VATFGEGTEDAFFTAEGLFHASIKEISYVSVFFRFRTAQVLVIQLGEDLREYLLQLFRGNHMFQPGPLLVVLRHRHIKEILWSFGIGEFIKIGRCEGVGHLARTVGAEIEEDNGVVTANERDRVGRIA
jgi:hypothetical protein